MEEKRIILEVKSQNFPNLFGNVNKYSSFINHLINEQTKNGFVLEPINNGLLYIYKNFNIFKLLNPIYSKNLVEKYKHLYKEKVSPNLLTKNVINKPNYPEEGIKLHFKIITDEKEELCFEVLKEHFESFRDDDIVFDGKSNSTFVVSINNYPAFLFYTSFLSSLIDGMIEDYQSENKDAKLVEK